MTWDREQDLIQQIGDTYWRSVDGETIDRQQALNEIIRLAKTMARLRVEQMFGPPMKNQSIDRKLISETFPEDVYFSKGHVHNLPAGDLAALIRRAGKNERSK